MIPLDRNENSGTNSAGGADTASLRRRPAVSESGVPFALPTRQPPGTVAPFAGRTGAPGPSAARMHMLAAGEEDR